MESLSATFRGTEKKLKQVKKNKDAFLDQLIQENQIQSSSRAAMMLSTKERLITSQDEPETYTHEVVKGIIELHDSVLRCSYKYQVTTPYQMQALREHYIYTEVAQRI
ncbi:hypothetical protein MKX01_026298 [Papaver californicum]|nr:hypothetical protein MKX01_026298 [Papaver californicum]